MSFKLSKSIQFSEETNIADGDNSTTGVEFWGVRSRDRLGILVSKSVGLYDARDSLPDMSSWRQLSSKPRNDSSKSSLTICRSLEARQTNNRNHQFSTKLEIIKLINILVF